MDTTKSEQIKTLEKDYTVPEVNVENVERIALEYESKESNTENDQVVKPRLSTREVSNKIMGIVYGCVLGELVGSGETKTWGFSTDQLVLMMETLSESGSIDISTFLQKFQSYEKRGMLGLTTEHKNIDEYTKEIVSSCESLSDPAKRSFDQYIKYNNPDTSISTCDNTPLIRCVMIALYNDWDSYSFASVMSTHADHRCISSGVVISSIIRSMLIGCSTDISEIVTDTASMILSMKKMSNQRDINEYMRFTSEGYCSDLSLLNLKGGNTKHTYKCMAQAIYALSELVKEKAESSPLVACDIFNKILSEIYEQGGDRSANCALSGALMGCEIGYDDLPKDLLDMLHDKDRIVLNRIVMEYLKHLGFVNDENDFDNILKKI